MVKVDAVVAVDNAVVKVGAPLVLLLENQIFEISIRRNGNMKNRKEIRYRLVHMYCCFGNQTFGLFWYDKIIGNQAVKVLSFRMLIFV